MSRLLIFLFIMCTVVSVPAVSTDIIPQTLDTELVNSLNSQQWFAEQVIILQKEVAVLDAKLQQESKNIESSNELKTDFEQLKSKLNLLTMEVESSTISIDTRIEDVKFYTNAYGFGIGALTMVLTFSAIALGIIVRTNAISEAKNQASKQIDEWIAEKQSTIVNEIKIEVEKDVGILIKGGEVQIDKYVKEMEVKVGEAKESHRVILKLQEFIETNSSSATKKNDSEKISEVHENGDDSLSYSNNSEEMINSAIQHYKDGEFRIAMDYANKVFGIEKSLLLNSSEPVSELRRVIVTGAQFVMALSHTRMGDYEVAIDIFTEIIIKKSEPKSLEQDEELYLTSLVVNSILSRGFCYGKLGKLELSRASYQSLIDKYSTNESLEISSLVNSAYVNLIELYLKLYSPQVCLDKISEIEKIEKMTGWDRIVIMFFKFLLDDISLDFLIAEMDLLSNDELGTTQWEFELIEDYLGGFDGEKLLHVGYVVDYIVNHNNLLKLKQDIGELGVVSNG
ncbi:hypothetical protein L2755_12135 [Shewanella abyssi]|uniref:tetratricopeptide repeat protein n=1 Tax=Shewanella abyssi TaxID=311789 RepID=UPI00200DB661|nr:tetratricopeptide repeat protein [Shewanella abyssi]MCL1050372.1 hypothetical protein [Shewanella abyssi]